MSRDICHLTCCSNETIKLVQSLRTNCFIFFCFAMISSENPQKLPAKAQKSLKLENKIKKFEKLPRWFQSFKSIVFHFPAS